MKKQSLFIASLLLFSNLVLSQIPNYIPENGLVGWWPFNGNANDESGNNHNGIVNGATLTEDRFGFSNTAYEFNNNSIVIPNDSDFDFVNLSLSLWIKTTSVNVETIIKQARYEDAEHELFSLNNSYNSINQDATGNINFAAKYGDMGCIPGFGWNFSDENPEFYETSQMVTDGVYHHIVCIIDGNIMKLFVDGSLWSLKISYETQITSCYGGDIQIGRDWSYFNHYYHGVVDDIGIWNRALTDDEVSKLYTDSSNGSPLNVNGDINSNTTINIYPNPTTDIINIDFNDLNKLRGGKVKIMNMSGQIVYEENITQSKIILSIDDRFSKGLYVVTTTDSSGEIISNEKLIIQ